METACPQAVFHMLLASDRENVWRLTVRSPKRYIDSVTLPNARDDALERGRLCVVIATIVINVIAVSLLTFAPWSDWRTGRRS